MGDDLRRIGVEVVFATADAQKICRLEVDDGTTLGQVVALSGLQGALDRDGATRVGVFGRVAELSDRVADGDRIEIYRDLLADPKTSRRRRAAQRIRDGARRG